MDSPANETLPLKKGEYLVQSGEEIPKKVRILDPGRAVVGTGEEECFDILRGDIRSAEFTLLFRNKVCHVFAEPKENGQDTGAIGLRINGKPWKGTVDDRRTQLARRFGAGPGGSSGETVIKAPMPGMVLKVLVEPGDEVQRDDGLIILEAMKMENEVRADHPGRVVKVECTAGKPVEKNARLITIHYEH